MSGEPDGTHNGYYWKLSVRTGQKANPYWRQQPRVPAGSPDGGRWTTEGWLATERNALAARGGRLTGPQARWQMGLIAAESKAKVYQLQKEQRALEKQLADMFDEHVQAMDSQDWEKANAIGERLDEQFAVQTKNMERIADLQRSVAAQQRELLWVDNPIQDLKVTVKSKFADQRKTIVANAPGEFAKMVGTGSVDGKEMFVMAGGRGRSSCSGSLISLTTSAWASTMIHEMGHWLEHKDPQVARKARAFLEKRTVGEQAKWLGDNYDRDEYAKFDEFPDPYSGKIYRHGATEIVSMGVQHLWEDPVKFANRDPEYFDFMYDLLRGR